MKSTRQKQTEALVRRKSDLESYRQTLNNPKSAHVKDQLERSIKRAEFDITNLESKLSKS